MAQLMPQIVASLYPTQFLELVVMRPAYWACIVLETSGITHFCWVLAWCMSRLFRMTEELGEDKKDKKRDEHENRDNKGYVAEVA